MKFFTYYALTLILILSTAFADRPKVGFSLPLTGVVANMGEGFRRGIELYTKDHPIINFDVLLDDHRYDGKQVVSSYQSFRTVKKADVIVVWGNNPADVAAPLAEHDGQSLITVSSEPVAKGRPTVFNFGFKTDEFANAVVEYIKANKFNNYGVLSINLGNALEILNLIKQKVPLKENFVETTDNDFVPQILKLRKQKLDGLLLFLLPDAALTYAQQAKTLQYSVPTLGGDVFADENFQKKIAATLPELSIIYGAATDAFKERLREAFGDASFYFESASAYSIMALLDGYYSTKEPPAFKTFVANADLKSLALPVEDLAYSESPEYGAMLACKFKITKALH